jgi:hypothetical protein
MSCMCGDIDGCISQHKSKWQMDFALISYHLNKFEYILCHLKSSLNCNDFIQNDCNVIIYYVSLSLFIVWKKNSCHNDHDLT